jgi:hypothetical protein
MTCKKILWNAMIAYNQRTSKYIEKIIGEQLPYNHIIKLF